MAGTNLTKQAAWIAVGSLFSFGFGIVSSVILSRYFNKTDYGTYRQVLYVYNTLLTVFTLGLPKAYSYFLPRADISQAKSLIRKITRLFFILGGIFSLFLFFFSPLIALLLKNPDLNSAIKIFAIVPFLLLPTMGLDGVLATYKKTMFMAFYTVLTRMIMLACVALPVMFFHCGYMEAITGFVIASVFSFILALFLLYLPVKKAGNEKCTITYREIFKFSLPLLYASLGGTVIVAADQFFISRYFGNEVFAEFSNGFMDLPFIGMIVGACATVLSPVFSKLSYENTDPQKNIYPLWMNVFRKTVMLIYPIVLYCWFFADVIMVILYGHKYENSSIYFKIKLVSNFFTLIAYGPLLINIGKVKYYANVHLYGAIILVGLEYLCVILFKSPYILAGVSVVCLIGRIYCLLAVIARYFSLKIRQLFPLKLMFQIILFSTIVLFVEHCLLLKIFSPDCFINCLIIFTISFVGYVILYLFYAYCIKLDYRTIIKSLKINS